MLSDRGIIMNAKTKIAIAVLSVLLVAAIIFGCVFYTRESDAASQNQALAGEVATLTEELAAAQAEVTSLTEELAAAQEEIESLTAQSEEATAERCV